MKRPDDGVLAAFCQKWRIAELAVFGSASRGEQRPDSDLDVMVRFDQDATWDLLDVAAIRRELSDLFGQAVDLLERGALRDPERRTNIERDLRVIYAA